jgi:Tol biopolymer transport system component
VSVDRAGGDSNGDSVNPVISDDGRYVAFASVANDLVPGDSGASDIFLRDLQGATTTRVSVDSDGGQADSGSWGVSISGDGGAVAFDSYASDLVEGSAPDVQQVFVRNLRTSVTVRVAADTVGHPANRGSFSPSLSDDGTYVAFASLATNLASPANAAGVFVRSVWMPSVDAALPETIGRGVNGTITLMGSGFIPGVRVSMSQWTLRGVRVNAVSFVSQTELQVSVSVDVDAPTGARNVWVLNPGTGPGVDANGSGVCVGCLIVS